MRRSAGTAPTETAAVGLDSTNLLAVQHFDLGAKVTDRNFAAIQEQSDALFSQLAGQPIEGDATRVAGLPALEYTIALDDPAGAETRAVAVFAGRDEYLLNCQSAPEQRQAIEDACDLALDTFETE